jgi:hypothetical protein
MVVLVIIFALAFGAVIAIPAMVNLELKLKMIEFLSK